MCKLRVVLRSLCSPAARGLSSHFSCLCSLPAKPRPPPPGLRDVFQQIHFYSNILIVQHLPKGAGACPAPHLAGEPSDTPVSESSLSSAWLSALCKGTDKFEPPQTEPSLVRQSLHLSWGRHIQTAVLLPGLPTQPMPHTQAMYREVIFAAAKTYLDHLSVFPLAEVFAFLSKCRIRCLSDRCQNGRNWVPSKAEGKPLSNCILQLKMININLWILRWASETRWEYWCWWLLFHKAVPKFGCCSTAAVRDGRAYQTKLEVIRRNAIALISAGTVTVVFKQSEKVPWVNQLITDRTLLIVLHLAIELVLHTLYIWLTPLCWCPD